ncbi:MAG: hypothetical protein QOE28_30 [Solirubrobacteraceae bacterium]|jgi:hypothetical protein|nr:hypothetical protein [Solirubrobacteraceae bacterium]
MTKPVTEPLRGEAAWRAAKKLVADHNDAAYAQGRRDRAARDAQAQRRRNEAERQSMQLPGHLGR